MERKIIFLDIDGVLQPLNSQKRSDYCKSPFEKSPMLQKYKILKEDFDLDFCEREQWNVAAVLYDWDKAALALLKLILNLSGAKIVISSDWRLDGFKKMKDFFTIHGLEKYLIDVTRTKDECFAKKGILKQVPKKFSDKLKAQHEKKHGKGAYLHYRTIEIFDWLHRNPDVKRWVAIDDMDLDGMVETNFVRTRSSLNEIDAEKCIRILTDFVS